MICLGIVGPGFVFVIDPYQKFRRAWYAPEFGTNERYILPGMARNYDHDTVVIGTSMAQNFYPSAVRDALGGRPIKLAMSGSTSREQAMLLDISLSTGRVRKVVWVVDHFQFRGPSGRVRDETVPFPYYLYDMGPWGTFRYLTSGPIQRATLSKLVPPSQLRPASNDSVPDGWNAFDTYTRFGRDRLMESYRKFVSSPSLYAIDRDANYSLATATEIFQADMLSRIRAHPEIEFIVVFPPYSLWLAHAYQRVAPNAFDLAVATNTQITRHLIELRNVAVFDFQSVNLVENEQIYSDLWHFNRTGNEFILQSIATGRHRVLDPQEIAASADRLKDRAALLPAP